jgi:hypothetical protein
MIERDFVVVEEKAWWQSKTMLFNIVLAVALAVEMGLPDLQPFFQPEHYAYLALAVNVVNVVLRMVTSAPVTLK